MPLMQKIVLYGLLGLLGVSLVGPGLWNMVRPGEGTTWLVAETIDARNHLRALNGMMAAVGLLALWACLDLENARSLVLALGVVMAALVAARTVSIVVDGLPGAMSLVYLAVEAVMAVAFLAWAPPRTP